MKGLLKPVTKELERYSGKSYREIFEEIRQHYLCSLDYVMLGVFGVPLFREHICFEDGDYCDFNLKMNAKLMTCWPSVFTQGKGYK